MSTTSVDKIESAKEVENKITAVKDLRKAFEQGADMRFISYGLTGIGNETSMILRKQLLYSGADINDISASLAGVGNKQSMELRDRLLDAGADMIDFTAGLIAVGNQESMELRNELLRKRLLPSIYISGSLHGVDNEDSMKWRKWLLNEGYKLEITGREDESDIDAYAKMLMTGNILWNLAGIDSEESMKLRGQLSRNDRIDLSDVLASLIWVNNEKSMDYRELASYSGGGYGGDVCLSLYGVDNPRSMELRKWLLRQADAKNTFRLRHIVEHNPHAEVARSLFGVGNQDSMILRRSLLENVENKKYSEREPFFVIDGIMTGLGGVFNPESMELREELVGLDKDTYLDGLAQSLSGITTPESNILREKYFMNEPNLLAKSHGSGPSSLYPAFIPLHGYKD